MRGAYRGMKKLYKVLAVLLSCLLCACASNKAGADINKAAGDNSSSQASDGDSTEVSAQAESLENTYEEDENNMTVTDVSKAEELFENLELTKGYKDITDHNPCMTQRFSADPGVMVYNDRVYVYATNDGMAMDNKPSKNEYGNIRTINMMSSKDLVNWEDHGAIMVAGGSGVASWAGNSWAPCACHKVIDGKEKFFLYFANSGNGIGVLTADSPTGPWEDPLGQALVPRDTPGIEGVIWLFDPAVLVDDDGTGYLYFGGGVPEGKAEAPESFRAVKLADDMIHLDGEVVKIDVPWGFEDSGINKIGDTYYYSYCTNWSGGPYGNARIGYMTSKSPLGPFTYQGTCFNNPGDFFGTTGNNHHTIITFNDQQYIFYHAEYLNKKMYGEMLGYRTTHVDKLPMEDGLFGDAKGTLEGVEQLCSVDAYSISRASALAWQGGASFEGSGDTLLKLSKGDWAGVSGVDFGSGATAIKLTVKAPEDTWIRVTTESADGEAVAYVFVPSSSDLIEVTAEASGLEGVQNLFFTAAGDVSIDSWVCE
jgi:arabinoxylan arabinofuranohydrolase